MDGDADIAQVGALLADPTRAFFLDEITARGPQTVGALARAAGVAPSVASQHVARLAQGRLVRVEAAGRMRIVSIASADVAGALEAVARVAPPRHVQGLRAVDRAASFRVARSCYDHLAGRLGVGLLDGMRGVGWIVPQADPGAFDLARPGAQALATLGVDVAPLRAKRRAFARGCLDVTERRPHLAGALGAAVLDALLARGWLARGEARALSVPPSGREALASWLGADALAQPG